MARCDLQISVDTNGLNRMLSSLSDVADRFPEFRDGLLGLFDTGEPLFAIDDDVRAAAATGEFVVRFKPTDSLLGLMSAFKASLDSSLEG